MPRIVLLGATGYTGSRVLARLAARSDVPVTLVGRSAQRLREQARSAAADCQIIEADTTAPGVLDGVLEADDIVISTVGPFVDLGREVVRSVARAGAVYLDSAGEPPFIEWVFRALSGQADATGALLVPGFGYDFVPGHVAGWLAAEAGGQHTDSIDIGYYLWRHSPGAARPYRQPSFSEMTRVTTPGTRESLAKVVAEPSFAYRANQADRFGLESRRSAAGLLRFNLAGRDRPAITIGGSEHLGLPEVLPHIRRVDVGLGWFGPASVPIFYGSRFGGALMTSTAARKATRAIAARLPYPNRMPDLPARTSVIARAYGRHGNTLAEVTVDGPGPYEFTADILARTAHYLADGHEYRGGVHGPLAALGSQQLVDVAGDSGLTVNPG